MELINNTDTAFEDTIIHAVATSQYLKGNLNYFRYLIQSFCDFEPTDKGVAYTEYVPSLRKLSIKLNLPQIEKQHLIGVIVHEVLHVLLGHFTRQKVVDNSEINRTATNLMLDYHINEYIEEENILLPEGAKDIIERLAQEQNQKFNHDHQKVLNSSIEEIIDSLTWLNKIEDDDGHSHSIIKLDEQSQAITQNSIEGLIAQVAKEAGLEGSLGKRLLSTFQKKRKVLSIGIIKSTLQSLDRVSKTGTYTIFNHMSLAYGYIKKKYRRENETKIVVGIDTSYSISEEEVRKFIRLCEVLDSQVDLVFWSSSKIDDTQVYKNLKPNTSIKVPSAGGTDIQVLYDYLDNYNKCQLVVVTDMEFDHIKVPDQVVKCHFFTTENVSEKVKAKYDGRTKFNSIYTYIK